MLNEHKSSNLNLRQFSLLDVTTTTLPDRLRGIMRDLGLNQTEFGRYVGASKGAVSQWIAGTVKSIDAQYAFALQRKAGYSAEWVMFGKEPSKLPVGYISDEKIASVILCMQRMSEYDKDSLVKISASLSGPGAAAAGNHN